MGNKTANLSNQIGSQEAFKSDSGDCYSQKESQCQVTIWKIRPVNNQREKSTELKTGASNKEWFKY